MQANSKAASTLLAKIADGGADPFFTFHLQPIIDLESERCRGAEVLVRGMVEGNLISPDDFIGALEENGDIRKVGIAILARVLAFAKKCQLHQRADFTLSCNFSPIEINDPVVVAAIKRITDAFGYSPGNIIIEITETAIPLSKEGEEHARWLQQCGFILAWDDITQMDDLAKNSPAFCSTMIKLDRSLLAHPWRYKTDDIIRACQTQGLLIVAEGVEYAWQRTWLREHGVKICQGYYYSQPMTAEHFAARYIFDNAPATHAHTGKTALIGA